MSVCINSRNMRINCPPFQQDGITNLNLYEPVCQDASHLWGHFSIVAKEILRVDKSSLQVLSKIKN